MNNRVSLDRVEVDGVTVEVSTIDLFGAFETMLFVDGQTVWGERHLSRSDAVHGHDAIVLGLEFGVWPS